MTMRFALAAAAVTLALAGCSPATSPAASPSPSASATPTVPTPTDAQAKDLQARLAPLAPKAPKTQLVRYARNTCWSILRKSNDDQIQKDAIKIFSVAADPVTQPEAKQILETIRANGFCQ